MNFRYAVKHLEVIVSQRFFRSVIKYIELILIEQIEQSNIFIYVGCRAIACILHCIFLQKYGQINAQLKIQSNKHVV